MTEKEILIEQAHAFYKTIDAGDKINNERLAEFLSATLDFLEDAPKKSIVEINVQPKFNLGTTVITIALSEFIDEKGLDINPLIKRHHTGDWGIVSEQDKQSNEEALISNGQLLSAYELGGRKIWIITEWDRSVTTVLFPEDY